MHKWKSQQEVPGVDTNQKGRLHQIAREAAEGVLGAEHTNSLNGTIGKPDMEKSRPENTAISRSADMYSGMQVQTVDEYKQSMLNTLEFESFRDELIKAMDRKEKIEFINNIKMNSKKHAKEHKGQLREFTIIEDKATVAEMKSITLTDLMKFYEDRSLDAKRLAVFKKSHMLRVSGVTAFANECRLKIKKSAAEAAQLKYVKLNLGKYKRNKLKCLSDLMRQMYNKFLRLGIDKEDVNDTYQDI